MVGQEQPERRKLWLYAYIAAVWAVLLIGL